MADKTFVVDGLPIALSWADNKIDPRDWRNLPDPDSELENDEDEPCPQYVKDVLGFDPDEFTEEDSLTDNYNPNQPRDSQGRFGSGGGSVSGPYKDSGGKISDQKPDAEDVVQIATEMRDRWEYKEPMQVFPSEGREFEQGGVKWKEGGNCQLDSGTVTIWRDNDWNSVDEVRHLASHEMMHGSYEKVHRQYKAEVLAIMDSGQVSKILKADGSVREEFKSQYPTYSRLQPFLDKPYELESDDGVTAYSKAYWKDYQSGKVSHHIAVHETLAEIAGLHESTGVIQGSKLYRDFYKATRDEYRVLSGSSKKRKGVGVTTNQRFDPEFVEHFKYLDGEFMPVENPNEAVWIKWWTFDGTTGWARKEE